MTAIVNTYLGGVAGGHPLKFKKCFVVQSESQGQKCAQQFINDPSVKFVLEGVLPFGATGFHQTNKGKKPVIGFNPISTSSATAKNTFEVTAGLFGTDPGRGLVPRRNPAREDRLAALPAGRPGRGHGRQALPADCGGRETRRDGGRLLVDRNRICSLR